jgi:hypothetical protein
LALKNTEAGMLLQRYPLNIWPLACLGFALCSFNIGTQTLTFDITIISVE